MKSINILFFVSCLLLIMVGCKQDRKAESPDDIIEKFNEYIQKGIANNPVVGISPEVQHSFSREITDSAAIIDAFNIIDCGIDTYPNRLDLRFGKITLANIIMDYTLSANTIIETLNYGKSIGNKWLWDGDATIEDVDEVMKEALHDYLFEFSTHSEMPKAGEAIDEVSDAAIEIYPDWVPALNFKAVRIMNVDAKGALEMFKEINVLAPNDVVVMINIGTCYAQLNDNINALIWYDKALKSPDIDESAKHQIIQLKSNINPSKID